MWGGGGSMEQHRADKDKALYTHGGNKTQVKHIRKTRIRIVKQNIRHRQAFKIKQETHNKT